MRKMGLFVAASMLALAGICGASGAASTSKVATRDWVAKQLALQGLRASTATVKDNGDGTVTVQSPFECDGLTNCTAIYFTVVKPTGASATPTVRLRPSLLSLFIPTAYAEVTEDGRITITLSHGGWIGADGKQHEFHFFSGGPWELELQDGTLPEVPSSVHVCELDADCNCVCMDNSEDDVEIPEEYEDVTVAKIRENGWFEISHWLDLDSWPAELTRTVGKGEKQRTVYYVVDDMGIQIDIEKITETDAWVEALAQALADINKRQKQSRDAYIRSQLCDKENPQHTWQTKHCGGNSWNVCVRNSSHTQGTPSHTGHTRDAKCLCGGTVSPHNIVTGEKVAKPGNMGWTQTTACTLGCGLGQTVDHDCIHEKCKPCSGGDGCNWPCPTCNGFHNFGGQTAGRCVRCQCEDCGITEREQSGGTVIITLANHSGWEACTEHDPEEGNERGGGRHCVCECGNFGCKHGTLHLRSDLDPTAYEDCEDDDLHHWAADKSACERCGDLYGAKEDHQYPEEVGEYRWLSNEKCARKRVCEKCSHETVDDLEHAGSHSPEGDPIKFEDIGSDDVCRRWYTCSKCYGEYYDDSQGHTLPQSPTKWENVSASICRAIKPCEKCGHEVHDDTQGHVKSTVESDGCKCSKCKEYQFAHTLSEDLCGNESCEICGWVDPNEEETHTGHTKDERCLCGRTESRHVWGDWEYVGRDGDYDVFRRSCTLSCGVSPMEKRVPVSTGESCQGNSHILSPTNDCTCLCGLYNPSSPSTDKNLHTFEAGECLCNCGKYHDKKAWPNPSADNVCPAVCSVCKTRSASGLNVSSAVVEDEHTPVTTGRCGCKCGKLNHSASSSRFHPKHPLTCRCYGSSGDGTGSWHYPCGFGSAYCPNVCSYPVDGKYHVANTGSEPVKESSKIASDADHVMRDANCGCKCGVVTVSDVRNRPASPLHNIDANSSGCGCFCGAVTLPHRIPTGYCTCYCDYSHTNAWENVCKVCSKCEYIIAHEEPKITQPDASNNHQYTADGCYCKCGEHLHADGHVYDADKCVCRCEEETREHILGLTPVSESEESCPYCHARFVTVVRTASCTRCGTTLSGCESVTTGEHRSWCRHKYSPKPTPPYDKGGCSVCGCYCSGGSHTSCGGHYCSACCTKPKAKRKKDKPNYTPPTYPDPCSHPTSTTVDDSYTYLCGGCNRTITVNEHSTFCANSSCHALLKYEATESEHGEHPQDEQETDDQGNTIDRCPCGCITSSEGEGSCSCSACQNGNGICTTCHQSCKADSGTDSDGGTESGGTDDLDDL